MAPKHKQKDKVLTEEEQALHGVHEDIIQKAVDTGVSEGRETRVRPWLSCPATDGYRPSVTK